MLYEQQNMNYQLFPALIQGVGGNLEHRRDKMDATPSRAKGITIDDKDETPNLLVLNTQAENAS